MMHRRIQIWSLLQLDKCLFDTETSRNIDAVMKIDVKGGPPDLGTKILQKY